MFVVAAILAPPDIITQTGLAVPLIALYEISIFSARMVEPKPVESADARRSAPTSRARSAALSATRPDGRAAGLSAACGPASSGRLQTSGLPPAAGFDPALAGRPVPPQRAWREAKSARAKRRRAATRRARKPKRTASAHAKWNALRVSARPGSSPPNWRGDRVLETLPNILDPDVPDGADETANVVLKRWRQPGDLDFPPKQHFELGEALGLMDFATAAKLAGARFVVLRGALARLERALGQFMLDLHTREHGYTEMVVPSLVNDATAYGTDQLPKFADDLFHTTDGRWLIPTAEVPLTNTVAGEIAGGEGPADPHDRADRLLSQRGRRRRPRHPRHAAPAPVPQGRDGVDRPPRPQRRRARAHGALRGEGAEPAGNPVPPRACCAAAIPASAPPRTFDLEVWLPGQQAVARDQLLLQHAATSRRGG